MVGLLFLAVDYCKKYHVKLLAEKTKLLVFSPKSNSLLLNIMKITNPLTLDGHKIDLSTSAEHVGI